MRIDAEIMPCKGMGDDKEYALKPIEEAAEIFGAWQADRTNKLIDEAADCIVSICSLLNRMGFDGGDLSAAIERANVRNSERGRL